MDAPLNIRMLTRLLQGLLASTLALLSASCIGVSRFTLPDPTQSPDDVILHYSTEKGLPGVAALVLKDGQVTYSHVAGIRKIGAIQPVEPDDAFHIGSCTKAMTALLCGILVDRGLLSWDSTLGAVLGSDPSMRPEYRDVTLSQLLSHSAGIPAELPRKPWLSFFPYDSEAGADRSRMVREILSLPPVHPAGTRFLYSNLGYVLAGAMAEKTTGKSWEILIQEELFDPLGMAHAGFGPPAKNPSATGDISAPWGHTPTPVDPTFEYADNPAALGPAGTVHANLADLAAYLAVFANHGLAPSGQRLVSNETLAALLLPRLDGYASGWVVGFSNQGTRFLAHDGSNTSFYCLFLVLPDKNGAVAVLANRGDANAGVRVSELAMYLASRYFDVTQSENP